MNTDDSITSIGIGLTNLCNLKCPHCYSRPMSKQSISPEDILYVLEMYPNVKQVNFGTGESILNNDFEKIIDIFIAKGIEMSLTTNGFTLEKISAERIKCFKDIDVSLDFPDEKLHDKWRGVSGTFKSAIEGIQKCKVLGVDVSIALCLMNNNYVYIGEFKKLIDELDTFLRINLYKPISTMEYLLSYEEFWEAIKQISENFNLISNSEPILSIITNDNMSGSACGNSVRIHPNLVPSGCVYINGSTLSVDEFRKQKENVPDFCNSCKYVLTCRGGCLGRRYLTNGVNSPDIYCPIIKGENFPSFGFSRLPDPGLIHSKYLCTLILK